MKKSIAGTLFLVFTLALLANCGGGGDDTTPPTSTLFDPPNYIFFNDSGEKVTFRGEASDNRTGFKVEISFDNGSSWITVFDDPQASRGTWSYAATVGDFPAPPVTIVTRATDDNGNVELPKVWATLNGPQLHTSASPTIGDLQSFYASANTILYLSSGTGGAYGTSAGGPALSSATELIVIGSGYGQAMTDGGYSAVAATPQTALETSDSAAFLFSAGADLLLANLRLTGGDVGVKASTAAPLDLFVVDCLFTDQDEWAVYVEDTGGAADDVTVNLYGSMIDASATTGTDHGGIYLEEVEYDVFDSLVKGSHLPSGIGGGVYAESGGGIIDSNVFFENAPAIWISDSSPTISYNIINGNAATDTRGINITTSGDPLLQFNQIKENKEYGVRIEGGTIPTLYRNIIEKNEESGIVFDGSFTGAVMPNLGNIVSSPPSNGQNIFLDNTNSTWADGGNIFVTNISTSVGLPITAENNWWDNLGQGFEPAIRLTIRDGVDWGGGQPIIDINPASPTKPN